MRNVKVFSVNEYDVTAVININGQFKPVQFHSPYRGERAITRALSEQFGVKPKQILLGEIETVRKRYRIDDFTAAVAAGYIVEVADDESYNEVGEDAPE